jgi:hypothetical protein
MKTLLLAIFAAGSLQAPPFAHTVSLVSAAQLPYSWHSGCPVAPARLRRLRVTYWGFDGRAHTGELVVHSDAVSDLTHVFHRLYSARFPIRRLRPIDAYGGKDERSLRADNTAAFNCRYVVGPGPRRWSVHAFLDRTRRRPGMAVPGGLLVRAFAAVGWKWGGRWTGSPDYQHFSATGG